MNNSCNINILRLPSSALGPGLGITTALLYPLNSDQITKRLCMDNERQCSLNTSTHVSTSSSSNTVGAAWESTEVLQRKLGQANARLTSLSLQLASTVDALDTQAKVACRDAALAAEDNHAVTRKLAILQAKYMDSEYERLDMRLAITELMDKST